MFESIQGQTLFGSGGRRLFLRTSSGVLTFQVPIIPFFSQLLLCFSKNYKFTPSVWILVRSVMLPGWESAPFGLFPSSFLGSIRPTSGAHQFELLSRFKILSTFLHGILLANSGACRYLCLLSDSRWLAMNTSGL